ncbi:hypothetical protein RNZ50_16270 [Paracoccaceae bacterium Fryx2]|nr:hypothetical protein [Paracoccaceae bacterium Fryx2]
MSLRDYKKLDDKFIASIDGPEPGKTVMRLRDKLADGLFLRVTKHVNAKGVEQVSKSWEFYFTLQGKTSCTGRTSLTTCAASPSSAA